MLVNAVGCLCLIIQTELLFNPSDSLFSSTHGNGNIFRPEPESLKTFPWKNDSRNPKLNTTLHNFPKQGDGELPGREEQLRVERSCYCIDA